MSTIVAVLGTGIMGAPMARNLAGAGLEVRAWNRTREKAEPLASDGVTVCDTAAEAASGADVLVTMLLDGDAVRSAASDALPELADGALWAQMSTVGLEAEAGLRSLADDAGVTYVDAPVSGTKAPAEAGKLVVLASGPSAAQDAVAPVFDAVGAKTIWAGDAGKGQALKLAVNSWVLSVLEGLSEAVAFTEAHDVDPQLFLDTIDGGPLDVGYAGMKVPGMLERSYDDVSFALSGAAKDARLIVAAAEAAGLSLSQATAIRDRFAEGVEAGHGDEDMASIVEVSRAR